MIKKLIQQLFIVSVMLFTKYDKFSNAPESFFDIKYQNIDFKEVDFNTYRGTKAFLVVNVACDCGLTTKNYNQLVELDNQLRDDGLRIMGFPSNNFFGQESRPESEIKVFVQSFGVKFELFKKSEVNGKDTINVYRYLRNNSSLFVKGKGAKQISWNFNKFLLNSKGEVVKYYGSLVNPRDIKKDIEKVIRGEPIQMEQLY